MFIGSYFYLHQENLTNFPKCLVEKHDFQNAHFKIHGSGLSSLKMLYKHFFKLYFNGT